MKKVFLKLLKIGSPKLITKISLGILVLALTIFLYSFYLINPKVPAPNSEINYLRNKSLDFAQLKAYFKDLSEKKGAVYAFEVLNKAPMPSGIDMHLLAHTVGDELYKQKGIKGMKDCTDDFRNACSHSIVINLFYEKGDAGINDINQACKEAPGKGGYSMCYHGLGHGVFAYADYQFPKTAELCKEVSSGNLKGPEYKECMGGAVMEQISGGDHDKISWQKQRDINLRKDNPLYPCMSDLITDPGPRQICLVYLTPYLWELAGKISAEVPDDVIIKSFEYCNLIPSEDIQNRQACFGGFGKEFLAMAKGKDVRNIDKLTDEEMQQIYHWCSLAPHLEGQEYCIVFAQGSMYWSGANDKKLPIHFCSLAPSEELKNYCFTKLITTIQKGDIQTKSYLKEFCSEIPDSLKIQCENILLK